MFLSAKPWLQDDLAGFNYCLKRKAYLYAAMAQCNHSMVQALVLGQPWPNVTTPWYKPLFLHRHVLCGRKFTATKLLDGCTYHILESRCRQLNICLCSDVCCVGGSYLNKVTCTLYLQAGDSLTDRRLHAQA